MKAIVLAGGHATRLWPVTKDRAKPLLPLGEKPIIEYIIQDLDDLEKVIISTNEKFAGDFEEYVEEYGHENARVVVENQDSEEEKPGTIGAIINMIETEGLEDDLFILGGDNYFGFSFKDLLEFCGGKEGPVNVVYDVKDFGLASSFGIVDVEDEKITGFEEKPEEPPSTLASTACYYFPEKHVSLFHEYEEHFKDTDVPEEKYLDEPGRLIEWSHERTEMFAFSFEGEWFDIGTLQGYLDAWGSVVNENIVNGDVRNSEVGENVFVMKGAELENVNIENSIVFHDSTIRNSGIRNSIIDRNCEIEDTDMNDAIVGEHTSL